MASQGPSTSVAPSTAAAPPSATTGEATSLTPDGDRIWGYAHDLAEVIGSRPPGSANERAAAGYLAEKLRSFGYDVQLQDFTISNDASRNATLSVFGSSTVAVPSVPFEGSVSGSARGALVKIPGLGSPSDFPANARGGIVIIERGTLLFRDKIANAAAAGATAAIIFNNEPGAFYGTLGAQSTIPAVGVSQSEGQKIIDLISGGRATGELSVDAVSQSVSYNVVAKPPGRECEMVSGGHYDSVQTGPGANDNASGAATVLELAALVAGKGEMRGNCFVLFGSEEIGLYGSRAFVQSLSQEARNRIRAMLNFDMVGVGSESWQLIGSAELQDRAAALATSLSVAVVLARTAGTGAGSDHASFINAGIPALFLHRTQDIEWHQPGDVAGRLQPELLETAARLGLALIESLNGGA